MPSDGYATTDDGLRLFYQRAGSGESVVLVPNGWYLLDELEPLFRTRTFVFYDVRNRGRSDPIGEGLRLARGIHDDVHDIDAVRRHFGADRVDLIGHSYAGIAVVLYAMKFPGHVGRIVQIGPMAPGPTQEYPAHLTNTDDVLPTVLARLRELEKERQQLDPVEFCRKFWTILQVIYVTDPVDGDRVKWSRCELTNERNFMKYWLGYVVPSIQGLTLSADDLARVAAPVLTVHGAKDRSAPYGAGREWALRLPNARLLTVERAAHAPWIEAPDLTLDSIETFLNGTWPPAAEQVTALDTYGTFESP